MTPEKIDLARLPAMKESDSYGFTTEAEAARFAAQINQPFYYWYAPNQTYYVPVAPGQKVALK